MDKLFFRETYLERLRSYYDDTDVVKIITGVKGCGKTSLLEMIVHELSEKDVPEENIIKVRLDKRPYKGVNTPNRLMEVISEKMSETEGIKYVFIDEIGSVEKYEEVLNRLNGKCSVFITASSGYILYPEHIKRIEARFINIEMFTLFFDEYIGMKQFFGHHTSKNMMEEFTDYMLQGGFPYVVKKGTSGNHQYTKDTLEYIFEHIIRHHKRIKNRDMYFAIQDYIVNNYGRAISIKSMQESLFEKLRQPIRKETLYNYLNILEDARIVYKCSRYDMKEKRIIKGKEKYYLSDLSIYYAADLYNTLDVGPSLENVVYAYARVHGYAVALGKSGRNEFDFAVEDANMDYSYIQVADHIVDGKIDEKGVSIEEEEEYKPLQRIRDSYPKYILTLDKITHKKMGIKHFNVIEFMLENGEF